MTSILKPKNPNPNIILTYKNMPLTKLDFHECRVFKNYDRKGVYIDLMNQNLQCYRVSCSKGLRCCN